ncbi:thioesterase II family protein [Bacillus gaemokensis]|uniref:Thioesterase n=1 Tax=Bacillus gaemokensis TaxID=574375 RepID=A0A073KCN5_9BACI|nr:thioesterase domain-containing protein [Bacillus gaemokensis]KEK20053.1 thioesterase [Bacillus gaemokensis]KYG29133.1 thioesterase [Bacillus gaemokensis]
MKLICLPYAGGSAAIFNGWKASLLSEITLENVELAGRGKRYRENFYTSVFEVVEDIYSIIHKELDDSPYAIFGHSMGSLLAFELGHKIQQEKRRIPEAFFFSGKAAPNFLNQENVHLYEKERFIKKIFSLGGTPAELMKYKVLLDRYLPIIRADYKIVETYKFQDNRPLLNTPFYIFYGDEDTITLDKIKAWENYTSKSCEWFKFDGNHFFIKQQERLVINLINKILIDKPNVGI